MRVQWKCLQRDADNRTHGTPLKIRGGFNVTFVDFEWSRPPRTVVDKLFLAIASLLLHPSTASMCRWIPFYQHFSSRRRPTTRLLRTYCEVMASPLIISGKLKLTSLPIIIVINNITMIIVRTDLRALTKYVM